jgi:hypothetical protein
VQVITNQFSAEYGRASGGRVNLRTRSGSKAVSRSSVLLLRDEALNANTFQKQLTRLPRLPYRSTSPDSHWRTAEGIPRQETVFFVSYELSKVLDSALIDTLVPVKQNALYFHCLRQLNSIDARASKM